MRDSEDLQRQGVRDRGRFAKSDLPGDAPTASSRIRDASRNPLEMFAFTRYKCRVPSMKVFMKLSVPTWRQTLIVVVGLALGLLLSAGRYQRSILRSRKAVCMEEARLVREAINQYTLDKNQPPKSLRVLVETRYLSEVPTDACMQELDSPPVLQDPVRNPNLSTFKLTSLN